MENAPFNDESLKRIFDSASHGPQHAPFSTASITEAIDEDPLPATYRLGMKGVIEYMQKMRKGNPIVGDCEVLTGEVSSLKGEGIWIEEIIRPQDEESVTFADLSDNPLYAEEFKKINDSIALASRNDKTKYTLDEGAIKVLVQKEQEVRNSLEHLERDILAFSSKRGEDPLLTTLTDMLELSKTIQPPFIPRLVTAFLDGKKEGYAEINPDLTEEDIVFLIRR
jgi:hypothetical protein